MKVSDPFFIVGQAIEMRIDQHGGLRAAARALKVDAAYLSRLKAGAKRDPSDSLLRKLGLRREVRYLPLPTGDKP